MARLARLGAIGTGAVGANGDFIEAHSSCDFTETDTELTCTTGISRVVRYLREQRLPESAAQALADRAKALGDPTRLGLALALAATDELCVCDLAWVSERAENLVSHHLRALRSAGLVSSRREGKMVMYRVTDAGRTLLEAIQAEAIA